MGLQEIIIAIGISALTGALASLIAPWANWGVEKRKKRLEWRKGFINECKRTIVHNEFSLDKFKREPLYANLSSLLSPKLNSAIVHKKDRYFVRRRFSLNEELKIVKIEEQIKRELLNEIALIEKKWGLI